MTPQMKKQLKEIAGLILALGVLQLGVFAFLTRAMNLYFLRSLAGTAAGCLIAVISMVMLAVGIENAVDKGEKGAQAAMSGGYMLRLAVTAVYVFAVIKLPGIFNIWAAVIPLIFPRLAIMIINLKNSKSHKQGGDDK